MKHFDIRNYSGNRFRNLNFLFFGTPIALLTCKAPFTGSLSGGSMETIIQKGLFSTGLISLLFVVSCSNKSSSSSSNGSASGTSIQLGSGGGGSGGLAFCNYREDQGLGLKTSLYSANGQWDVNFLKMRILKIPADFKNGSQYLQVYKWKANTQGLTYMDPQPLSMRLMSGDQALSQFTTYLNFGSIRGTMDAWKLTSVEDFFSRTQILLDLKDPQSDYDVLKIVVYNSQNQAVKQLDILIPAFAANPEAYKKDPSGGVRASILQNLHPMMASAAQGWGDSHFQSVFQSYCF